MFVQVRPTQFLVEQMSHAQRRWDRAWRSFVDRAVSSSRDVDASFDAMIGSYGLDPRASLPWVEDVTVEGAEEMLEDAGALPFTLTLREPDPRFPDEVNRTLNLIAEEWVPDRPAPPTSVTTSTEDARAMADEAFRSYA